MGAESKNNMLTSLINNIKACNSDIGILVASSPYRIIYVGCIDDVYAKFNKIADDKDSLNKNFKNIYVFEYPVNYSTNELVRLIEHPIVFSELTVLNSVSNF